MGHHHKAASCSAIPSFQSFTSVSTTSTQTPSLNLFDQEPVLKRSIPPSLTKSASQQSTNSEQTNFPLPSFCLYSKRALINEYAPESDIIQFLSPISNLLEERLPMFVGVLQSLFTVVSDLPFVTEDIDSDIETDTDDDDDADSDPTDDAPFTIIGLNSMKLVIWNNMYDNIIDTDIYEKDLCLVVMVSSQVTDDQILDNMNLLRKSVTSATLTANQIGEQLIPLIESWFSFD
ncbi:uncharacterized protein EV154DRAFT_601157 [Mucor mucedo]|uniref:uncharacterized protein n=1 Tax=Mucor mucedo TaxID=29922 RepID=UPI00221FDAAF|nr:uncharacterized protein EV154DRAFT_601157 [Mucor mucedo]KAI7893020.1 hypothetical protein EV154DRAFT_601157 [Mucor mucedo]